MDRYADLGMLSGGMFLLSMVIGTTNLETLLQPPPKHDCSVVRSGVTNNRKLEVYESRILHYGTSAL
jgi:hypothetical protein